MPPYAAISTGEHYVQEALLIGAILRLRRHGL